VDVLWIIVDGCGLVDYCGCFVVFCECVDVCGLLWMGCGCGWYVDGLGMCAYFLRINVNVCVVVLWMCGCLWMFWLV